MCCTAPKGVLRERHKYLNHETSEQVKTKPTIHAIPLSRTLKCFSQRVEKDKTIAIILKSNANAAMR